MDRGPQYDWDRHNLGHIAAHRVEPHEVEEVLANEPIYVETRTDSQSGEERVLELGHTNTGRVLFVAWTPRRTAKPVPHTRGDAMKKNNSNTIDAETAFAADVYRDRAAINRKAQAVLAAGSRQVTIRLGNNEIALARRQAEAKGLRYQTYIKMLLHEALARNQATR
jgi:predicted DNA binding CopG/RHH family protein/uncharacterized DUF497 family protein